MADETKTEETESTEQVEKTDEIPQEALDVQTKFDDAIEEEVAESEEEESTEKTDDETEEKPKEETEEKAVEETPAEDDKVKSDETDSAETEQTVEKEDAPIPDDSLLERAVSIGISLGDARDTKPETLERIVVTMEAKSEKTEEKEPEKYDCKLDPEKYDKEVIDMMNMNGQVALDLKVQMEKMAEDNKTAMEGLSQKTTASDAQRARRDLDNTMDTLFNGLEGFEKTFGKGKISDMDEGTPEHEKRMDIEDKMLVLLRGYKASGQDVPGDDELFKQALRINHAKETTQAANAKTVKALKKQSKQAIGTGAAGSEATTKMNKAVAAQKIFDDKVNDEVDD